MLTKNAVLTVRVLTFSLILANLPSVLTRIDWNEQLNNGPWTFGDSDRVLVDSFEFNDWMWDTIYTYITDADDFPEIRLAMASWYNVISTPNDGGYVDIAT